MFVMLVWGVLRHTRKGDDIIPNTTAEKLMEMQSDPFLSIFFILNDEDEMHYALSPP